MARWVFPVRGVGARARLMERRAPRPPRRIRRPPHGVNCLAAAKRLRREKMGHALAAPTELKYTEAAAARS